MKLKLKKKKIKKVKAKKEKKPKTKRIKMTKDEKKVIAFISFLKTSKILDNKVIASPFERAIMMDTLKAIVFRLLVQRTSKIANIGYDARKGHFDINKEEK